MKAVAEHWQETVTDPEAVLAQGAVMARVPQRAPVMETALATGTALSRTS
jgi:hypothetical protein